MSPHSGTVLTIIFGVSLLLLGGRLYASSKGEWPFSFVPLDEDYVRRTTKQSPKPKVAVVGAGLAGLTTAYRLSQHGFDVTVYEARTRPGGRVFTYYYGDKHQELGGAFINDGGQAREMCDLIKELGLETELTPWNLETGYYCEEKKITLPELFAGAPAATDEAYAALKKQADASATMGEIIDTFLAGHDLLRRYCTVRTSIYEGCPAAEISHFYLDNFWSFYQRMIALGDRVTVKGGTYRLIEALCEKLPNRINYGMPLRKLSEKKDGRLCLTFDNGVIVETGKVVLAIPCSTLRDVVIQEGLIPEDQMQVIKTLQYGTSAKILVPFSSPKEPHQLYAATSDAALFVDPVQSMVTLYFGGKEGVFDATSKEVVNDRLAKLLPVLTEICPDLTFMTEAETLAATRDPFVEGNGVAGISWANEEFSKGSYSCVAPGQEKIYKNIDEGILGSDVIHAFRSVKEKIFFAGEHTSTDVPSTMQGAVESGERTARILRMDWSRYSSHIVC